MRVQREAARVIAVQQDPTHPVARTRRVLHALNARKGISAVEMEQSRNALLVIIRIPSRRASVKSAETASFREALEVLHASTGAIVDQDTVEMTPEFPRPLITSMTSIVLCANPQEIHSRSMVETTPALAKSTLPNVQLAKVSLDTHHQKKELASGAQQIGTHLLMTTLPATNRK